MHRPPRVFGATRRLTVVLIATTTARGFPDSEGTRNTGRNSSRSIGASQTRGADRANHHSPNMFLVEARGGPIFLQREIGILYANLNAKF
jgi:hypothetical protein